MNTAQTIRHQIADVATIVASTTPEAAPSRPRKKIDPQVTATVRSLITGTRPFAFAVVGRQWPAGEVDVGVGLEELLDGRRWEVAVPHASIALIRSIS